MATLNIEKNLMQFLSYTLVGCIATLAHYSLLVCFVELLSITPWLASIYGAMFGAFVSYALNRVITFSQSTKPHSIAFLRFFVVAIIGALSNGILVWIGIELLGLHYLIAQFLATLITFITTFQLNKSWTFM